MPPHKYAETAHKHTSAPRTASPLLTSGVTPMTKLIYRNKYLFSLAVLAMLALSSGAALKWY